MVMTHIYYQMLLGTRKKNMYGLGVGISIVYEIFSNFTFLRVELTPGVISNVFQILPVTLGICF
jgi:hypothetical protein